MAKLTDPRLTIRLISGTSDADCTATVNVKLTDFELFLVKAGGLKLRLNCDLMGADSGATGGDDFLVAYPAQLVAEPRTCTFRKTVNRSKLDEDSFPAGDDEVKARFILRSTEPSFPITVKVESPEISGDF